MNTYFLVTVQFLWSHTMCADKLHFFSIKHILLNAIPYSKRSNSLNDSRLN